MLVVVLSASALPSGEDDVVLVEVAPHPQSQSAAASASSFSSPSSPSILPRAAYPPVVWYAPFFSGGGYSSEALAFVLALQPHLFALQVVQHGDAVSHVYYRGLAAPLQRQLVALLQHDLPPSTAVSVCHSEPGAWHPSRYPTARCPPPGSLASIGRTMFETDRLPSGWSERLQRMDEVWVPTEFSRRVFVQGGVDEHRVVVVPEPVDVDTFRPGVPPMELVKGEARRWQRGEAQRPFRFLSIFKCTTGTLSQAHSTLMLSSAAFYLRLSCCVCPTSAWMCVG